MPDVEEREGWTCYEDRIQEREEYQHVGSHWCLWMNTTSVFQWNYGLNMLHQMLGGGSDTSEGKHPNTPHHLPPQQCLLLQE